MGRRRGETGRWSRLLRSRKVWRRSGCTLCGWVAKPLWSDQYDASNTTGNPATHGETNPATQSETNPATQGATDSATHGATNSATQEATDVAQEEKEVLLCN